MAVPVRGGGDAEALAAISETLLARLLQEHDDAAPKASCAEASGGKGLWGMNAWLLVEVSEWNATFAHALIRFLLATLAAIVDRQRTAVGTASVAVVGVFGCR